MTLRAPAAAALAMAGVLAGATGAGCGGGAGQPPPPPPGDVTVELGGADDLGSGFVPLAGDVHLIPGGQGGFHFWLKYRLGGAASGSYHLAYKARRVADGTLILVGERSLDIQAPTDGGAWESPAAIPAFMCPSPVGVQVHDQAIRVELHLMGAAGGEDLGAAQADVTPRCPTDDQAAHCAAICSG